MLLDSRDKLNGKHHLFHQIPGPRSYPRRQCTVWVNQSPYTVYSDRSTTFHLEIQKGSTARSFPAGCVPCNQGLFKPPFSRWHSDSMLKTKSKFHPPGTHAYTWSSREENSNVYIRPKFQHEQARLFHVLRTIYNCSEQHHNDQTGDQYLYFYVSSSIRTF